MWLLNELTTYDVTPCWKQVILFNIQLSMIIVWMNMLHQALYEP